MLRKLILLAFLLGLAQSAWAVPALVRLCPASATLNGGNNVSTTATCIFASNAASNFLFIFGFVDVNTTLTIGDTAGNTYTTILTDTNQSGVGTTHVWAAYNSLVSVGANTVTVTAALSSSNSFYVGGGEYSGLATSAALDQVVNATGASTTPNSGNVTTTVPSELFIGISAGGNGSATLSAGTNIAWVMQQKTISGNRSPGWEDFIASSTQTVSANFTYSGSVSWNAIICTFKTPAVGGGAAKKKRPGIFY